MRTMLTESTEKNAFVIPGGKVFVFSGILPIAKNDDGLAAILGHEIAHNLARHAAENMSSMIPLFFLRYALIVGFHAADAVGLTFGMGQVCNSLVSTRLCRFKISP
jgi:Zn-dependent protease with chaperone function